MSYQPHSMHPRHSLTWLAVGAFIIISALVFLGSPSTTSAQEINCEEFPSTPGCPGFEIIPPLLDLPCIIPILCLDEEEGDETPATITIWKYTYGGNGTFSFTVTGTEGEGSTETSIQTEESWSEEYYEDGSGSADLEVAPGTYDLEEIVPDGWSLESSECEYDGEEAGSSLDFGERLYLDPGDHVDCYFFDSTEGYGTLIVEKHVVNDEDDGGTSVATDFFFQLNGEGEYGLEGVGDTASHTFDELTPGFYTVTEFEMEGYETSYENCEDVEVGPGETETCVITNDDVRPESDDDGSTPDSHANPSGGGGGGGGGGGSDDGGEVLGASTDSEGEVLGNSCPLIMSFMREGGNNDPAQVSALQTFLNGELGLSLVVNGLFDAATTKAVMDFQLKYWEEVLKPWAAFGLPEKTPTGFVYKTTAWKINDIACPDTDVPFPTLP